MATTADTQAATPTLESLRASEHAIYTAFLPTWVLLAHVREGTGGFLDGKYLIAHPREWEDYDQLEPVKPTKKLTARRRLACYENVAATIIEAKRASLFREVPARTFADKADEKANTPASRLRAWWNDVDGAGTAIDDYIAWVWDMAATFGHVWLYMDRPKAQPGATAADASAPFLRVYTPIDLEDWVTDDRGRMTRMVFREPSDTPGQFNRRVITADTWTVFDTTGAHVSGGTTAGRHEMGAMPVVPLFAKRRALYRHIGQSVLGDPKLYQDIYNLTSEIRELLRNQTFSFLNIPLGTGENAMDVERAKSLLGGTTGAMNVIFSGESAQILAGDSSNVQIYHAEVDRRMRTIYRLVGVQWESDVKQAEAAGSLSIKREDMNTRLAAYADECEKAEYAIAKLWFAATSTSGQAERDLEAAGLRIKYPDAFDVTPFEAVLAQAQAMTALEYPTLVMREVRKALLDKFLPDLASDLRQRLIDAIDADDTDALAQLRQTVERTLRTGIPAAQPDQSSMDMIPNMQQASGGMDMAAS